MLFDCDGVLVDSERIAVEVEVGILGDLGWEITPEEVVELFLGVSDADYLARVEDHLGITLPEGWLDETAPRYRAAFERELRPVPGVVRALDALDRAGVTSAVTSSGTFDKLRFTLGLTGLWHRFEGRIFSATEVARGKPAPDLFLYAAEHMGVAPERCVVVEDSLPGVKAALAAGMRPVAYAGGLVPVESLSQPGVTVIDDMGQLVEAVHPGLRPSPTTRQSRAMAAERTHAAGERTYHAVVGSQRIDLPLVEVTEGLSIALLISVDQGLRFSERAGAELADLMRPYEVEIVVSVATMGIPLAIEVSRALGLDDYAILHKTPKIHLTDAVAEPVRSITTAAGQRLLFDRARIHAVSGKRVGIVDDVISTGASSRAALNLVRRIGGDPIVFGALLTEASGWQQTLGDDARLVRTLGSIPVFRRQRDGSLIEDWGEGGPPAG